MTEVQRAAAEDDIDRRISDGLAFFATHYEMVGQWLLRRDKSEPILGRDEEQRCRFCGGQFPNKSFKHDAHAIPEALGNKTLFSAYECDCCNDTFGRGIENDLGNWSKPMRTLGLIAGKSGVPTLKGKFPKEWRIEGTQNGLDLKHHSEDVIATVDESAKTMTLRLPRDAYTPLAVFKAFAKIGLSLIPRSDLSLYSETFEWIADEALSKPAWIDCTVQVQSMPGPPRSGGIGVALLRRNNDYSKVPFCLLILMYGVQSFQISIPSFQKNWAVPPGEILVPCFPTYSAESVAQWGPPQRSLLDLGGTDVVRGEILTVMMKYDQRIRLDPEQSFIHASK